MAALPAARWRVPLPCFQLWQHACAKDVDEGRLIARDIVQVHRVDTKFDISVQHLSVFRRIG